MHKKRNTRGRRRRRLLQLGSAGLALALTLGAPAASEMAPVPTGSEVQAQMPDPFGRLQLHIWYLQACLMTCYPEWALCCPQDSGPLY